jgi:hypothetical protein
MSTESRARWAIASNIAAATGATTLQAAPGAGRVLMVQKLQITINTAAAQTFDIEDTAGTVEIFKAVASLASTTPINFDFGELGVALTANNGLVYTPSAAGVVMTIGAHGYIKEA